MQVHARSVTPAHEKLLNSHRIGKLLKGLLCVANRKWHQNGARPGRNLVDVEPEPVGKEDDFRWNGRAGVVIVLTEKAKVELGESIDFGDPAEFEDLFPGPLHRGILGAVTGEFQAKIRLHGSADIRWATVIDAPSAVLVLMLQDIARGFRETPRVHVAQHGVQDDVIGFESGIRFELTTPVAIIVL